MSEPFIDATESFGYVDEDLPRLRQVHLVLAESYSPRFTTEDERQVFLERAEQEGRLPEDWRELYRWYVFERLNGSGSEP